MFGMLTLAIVTLWKNACRILRGKGQVVNGDKGVTYTHKELTLQP